LEPPYELGQHVAGDLALAAFELQAPKILERFADRVCAEIGDREAAEIDRERLGVQAPAIALGADAGLDVIETVASAVDAASRATAAPPLRAALRAVGEPRLVVLVVVRDRRETGAETGLAPAVARVVREPSRIERLEAAPAARARALGRVELAGGGAGAGAAAPGSSMSRSLERSRRGHAPVGKSTPSARSVA